MSTDLDYVSHLSRESARFAAAVAEAVPGAPVPTCPKWDVDDLLWHLAEVQWFWATIVGQALQAPPPAEVRPERPASRSELASFYVSVGAELACALGSAAPQDRVWTWSSDHTVGFVRRRQAHEALIHRIDVELTVGSRTPMDAQLSDDGIDEALRVMYGHAPDWATFSPSGAGVVRLRAADTASTWLVGTGRLTGTDPDDGTPVDEACLEVADDRGAEVQATLTGSAADLDCWLWRRPTIGTLERAGDHRLLEHLEAVIRPGID
ncbi:MAG: maleylpyruvate isomerase family mycothiol-dependent enzyme [Mycobacteriales bacterium]